ncbi:MAG: hypothetical protein HN576_12280 [Bacteriovoracaceae bacterium]|jgi:hypothetical protein|nr:hypothetical protein [Bacteriovoracaceae bacterium]
MNNNSQNSNNDRPKSSAQNKRQRNNRNKKKSTDSIQSNTQGLAQKNQSQKAQNSNNRPKNRPNNRTKSINNNKKRRNRRAGPPLPLNERIYKKFDHLIEVLGHARKKYFELFFRADPRQKKKLKDNYDKCLATVHKFEDTLTAEEVDIFRTRFKNQDFDRTYTSNHEISPLGDEVTYNNQFPDPHYLLTQKEADYSQDSEESSGSMDDYNAYKGV